MAYFNYGKVVVWSQPTLVANNYVSTLTFVAGTGMTITTNANSGTVTFNSTSSGGGIGGGNLTVQYNNNGNFAGSAGFTFNPTSNTLSTPNLQTSQTVNFSSASSVNLGNIGNLYIGGGSPGYVLTTNGSGGLSWTQGGGGGGGAQGTNQTVQFNNNGSFAGSSNFTYDSANSKLTVGNIVTNNISSSGNSNLGSINATSLISSGNITGANITGNMYGNGSGLSSLTGANVIGQVNYAAIANNVAGANVTGIVGNSTHANISDSANSVNVSNVVGLGNISTINFTGDSTKVLFANGIFASVNALPSSNYANYAGNAFNVAGSNVTGQVNFAAVANSVAGANVVGQVNYAAVANRVAGANVTGQVSNALMAGTVYTNSQPNITSVGTLTNLSVSANANIGTLGVTGLSNLGAVGNVKILGGTSGQYLQTDGAGNLTWAAGGGNGGGGNTLPGGLNKSVQFNNNGIFAGSTGFVYDSPNNQLTVGNVSVTQYANLTIINAGSISASGKVTAAQLQGDGGNISNINGANVYGLVANATTANTANTAITVTGNNQPNITSVGTLTTLSVAGNVSVTNLTSSGNLITQSLQVNSNANLGNLSNITIAGGNAGYVLSTDGLGNLSWRLGSSSKAQGPNTAVQYNLGNGLAGNGNFTYNQDTGTLFVPSIVAPTSVDFRSANSVNLGNISNLHISGGINGYYLQTDGTGNLTWAPGSGGGNGGGNGTPGGSNTQVQFNDAGVFNGDPGFTYNKSNSTLTASRFSGSGNGLSNITGANVVGFVSGANVANYVLGGNVSGTVANANYAAYAGNVVNASQSNITSVGVLTSLSVSGNATVGNITATSGTFTANVKVGAGTGGNITGANNITSNNFIGGNVTATGLITSGNVNFTNGANLGNLANVRITGGLAGQVLSTYGNGTLYWGNGGGGGGLQSRTSSTVTVANLTYGNIANTTIFAAKSFALYSITTSVGAWVTIYTNSAALTADANRTIGTDPTPGSGVLAEIVGTGNATVTQLLTPPAICFNSENPVTPVYPIRIQQNAENASRYNVTVTLTYLPME